MGENIRVSENLFVLPVDMEGKSVDDIAREAAKRIVELCDQVGREREASKKKGEDVCGHKL